MNLCMVRPLMGLWHLLHTLEAEPCFCSLGSYQSYLWISGKDFGPNQSTPNKKKQSSVRTKESYIRFQVLVTCYSSASSTCLAENTHIPKLTTYTQRADLL